MKYSLLFVLLIAPFFLLQCQLKDNRSNQLDLSRMRSIERTAFQKKKNEEACLIYLDSLARGINNDTLSAYGLFLKTLKVKFNSKISYQQKVSYFVNQTQIPSFKDVDNFNKFKITMEISACLRQMGNYNSSIEECLLASQYINSNPLTYNIELAELYTELGWLAGAKFEKKSNLKRESYSRALKIYRDINDNESSARILYSLAITEYDKQEYNLAKKYIIDCISEQTKFTSDVNTTWGRYYCVLFDIYQKLNQTDSAYSVYKQAKIVYEKKSITEERYATFLAETLVGMIELKNYQEAEKNIAYLTSFYKDTCENRYRYCLIYNAKSLITKDKKLQAEEKDNLIKLLHYSRECGQMKGYFTKVYSNSLDRLIELAAQAKDEKDLNIWYKKRLDLNHQFDQENEVYLKYMDFWMDLQIDFVQKKMNAQNEKLETEKMKFIFISLFSAIILIASGIVLYLYKKIKNNEQELKNKQQSLKNVNQFLAERNEKLIELYKEMDYKNNIISSQNTQMTILVDKLRESNENLTHFAQSAAHDLKAPLRTISSFSRILQKRYHAKIEEKDTEFFKFIIDGCHSLDKIIEGLLQFSTISGDDKNLQAIDLVNIIESVQKKLHIIIKEAQPQINYPSSIPLVKGQSTLIEQLFLNLINNAIKFRKRHTPSVINIEVDDFDNQFLRISISDNGIGIDPLFHKDIFQMFRKLHSMVEYTGSGIGLATCEKIIHKFGGDIWVESEINKGSTFFFTLPKAHV